MAVWERREKDWESCQRPTRPLGLFFFLWVLAALSIGTGMRLADGCINVALEITKANPFILSVWRACKVVSS